MNSLKTLLTSFFIITLTQQVLNINSAKCLLRVVGDNIKQADMKLRDEEVSVLLDLMDEQGSNSFELLNDTRVYNDINYLMINFDNLSSDIKQKIHDCHLNLEEAHQRCQQNLLESGIESECVKYSDVGYIGQCPDNTMTYNNFFCYDRCPDYLNEHKNHCRKSQGYTKEVFSCAKKCSLNNEGKDCNRHESLDIYTPQCREGFKTKLFVFCVPKCPPGMIENGDICMKSPVAVLSAPEVFTFNDLYE